MKWYDALAEHIIEAAVSFFVMVVLFVGGYWFLTEGPGHDFMFGSDSDSNTSSITYTDCEDEVVGYDQSGRALWQTWCDGKLVASDVEVPDWCYERTFSDTPVSPPCYGEGWYEQHTGGLTCEEVLVGYDQMGYPLWETVCR